MFRLGQSPDGIVEVANKPQRVAELLAFASKLRIDQFLRPAEARAAAGRFQFAPQQVFGKSAAPMLRLLHLQGVAASQLLVDESLPQVVADLAVLLLNKPVRRCRVHRRAPVHVFTDGAAEEGEPASAAGVIYDPESGLKQFF